MFHLTLNFLIPTYLKISPFELPNYTKIAIGKYFSVNGSFLWTSCHTRVNVDFACATGVYRMLPIR